MPNLRYSKLTALVVASAIIIGSGISLGLIYWQVPGGNTQTFLANVADTFLALGLVGLIYEVFLRDIVFRETVETIGIREDVVSSALSSIGAASAIKWADLLDEASQVDVLIVNPMGWLERDWDNILQAARDRKLTITIYLLDSTSEVVAGMATKLGYPEEGLRDTLKQLRDYLESSWKTAVDSVDRPTKGSKISIRLYDFMAAYDVAASESRVALLVPEVGEQKPSGTKLMLTFNRRRGKFPASWFAAQLESLGDIPDEFADEVKS